MSAATSVAIKQYFCWVRVVKLSADARAVALSHSRFPPLIRSGSRPPNAPVAPLRQQRADLPEGDRVIRKPTDAVALFSLRPGFDGREGASTGFDIGPAFDDEFDATDWLQNTREGRRWDADALNRYLMHVEVGPDSSRQDLKKPCECGKPNSPNDLVFPAEDWEPGLRDIYCGATERAKFLGATLPELPGPPTGTAAEKEKALLIERALRWPIRETAVREAAYSPINVVALLLDVLPSSLLPERHSAAVRKWRDELLAGLQEPIYVHKAKFRRARPHILFSGSVKSRFQAPHWNCPAHPAYPGGHATVAYTFAKLLGAHFGDYEVALDHVAQSIAEDREVAGLHYPSDTADGKVLAGQVVAAIADPTNKSDDMERLRKSFLEAFPKPEL
jgi:hypothetical protein